MPKRKSMFEQAMPAQKPKKKRDKRSERNGTATKGEGAGGCDPLLAFHQTDTGNGLRLVHLHGADLRYCHPWKKWLCWDGQRWREDDRGRPELLAKVVCRELLKRASCRATELAAKLQAASPDQEGAITAAIKRMHELQAFAFKSEHKERLAAIVALARSEPGIPILPSALNSDPWLFNCPNGTIDLRTGKLRKHGREDYLTQICPTSFEPNAKCPAWLKFLEQVFPATGDAAEAAGNIELIEFVQRVLGYALAGSVREHLLPICWGTGRNGKSTLLNAVSATLGPHYSGKAPRQLLTAKRGEHHPTELATLFGKRFVCAIETEAGQRLAESLVKELTGGDPVTCRRMKEDFWTFNPTHTLILCTNHKPRVLGRDVAMWTRIRLVPFIRRFTEEEQDKALPEKLLAERPGILSWLVRGCLQWQAHGLGETADVRAATSEYKSSEDLLAAFIRDRCATGSDEYRARASDLYDAYKKWCDATGEHQSLTSRQLCAALREEGFQDFTSAGLWFRGIAPRHFDSLEQE
jgi:putative DNA primase/helicase